MMRSNNHGTTNSCFAPNLATEFADSITLHSIISLISFKKKMNVHSGLAIALYKIELEMPSTRGPTKCSLINLKPSLNAITLVDCIHLNNDVPWEIHTREPSSSLIVPATHTEVNLSTKEKKSAES
eukprot:TRINITY_DN12301_c2_g1_i2.p1 TRINITY_DN12301_c2_g1~~TRINITY_DN12301_c2_g1_i2.p1  ORF type:complete len:126 (-),score=15.11 TRINITY_DN12301_c2_g1_i2:138-515(-)